MAHDNEQRRKQFHEDQAAQNAQRSENIQGQRDQNALFDGGKQGGLGAQGGVQGANRLNDNPEIRRAITSKRAELRDYRLARRDEIRKGNRLGAAKIGEAAKARGLNLHGLGRFGDDQEAAATSIQSESLAAESRHLNAADAIPPPPSLTPPPAAGNLPNDSATIRTDAGGGDPGFNKEIDEWFRNNKKSLRRPIGDSFLPSDPFYQRGSQGRV